MDQKDEREKHEQCLTLYPVPLPPSPTKPTRKKKSNKINQSQRKARVFAMATAHLELLHRSISNLS